MQLDYKLTVDDWKAALRLHARQEIGRRIHYFNYDFVFPTVAIIGPIFVVYAQLIGDAKVVQELEAVVTMLVGLAIILPLFRQYAVRSSFKGFFSLLASGPGYSLDVNDERIVSTRPGVGEATYYWAGIRAVAENKKIILLDNSEILFLGIPIHIVSTEQRTELENLIARRVTKRQP
jgi:hypothetical protein